MLNPTNVTIKYHDRKCSPPQCRHMSFVDFVVLPPGHGRSVTDFWGWDAHKAQLHCPDGVWVVIEEDVVPGGALNLNSTNLTRPWSPRESSPSRKIPTVESGIEPGTSWLVVRDSEWQVKSPQGFISFIWSKGSWKTPGIETEKKRSFNHQDSDHVYMEFPEKRHINPLMTNTEQMAQIPGYDVVLMEVSGVLL